MAYDRFDPRNSRPESARYGRDRWGDDDRNFSRNREDERGFFERAGDEIASWFGDDDAERRREREHMSDDRFGRDREFFGRDRHPTNFRNSGDFRDRDRDRDFDRGRYAYRGREPMGDRTYRPSGNFGDQRFVQGRYDNRESFFGSTRDIDPNYSSFRQRHLDELDRDYDQYREENRSRFENEFGSWRQQRLQKRSLLGTIREQMEVVGSDDEHVGTVDRIAGDRIILAKSDPDSGGVHHSLMCSSVDRIEGDKVILDCDAEQAKSIWRDENRSRALFEREDQGEAGPMALGRSFEGTYR